MPSLSPSKPSALLRKCAPGGRAPKRSGPRTKTAPRIKTSRSVWKNNFWNAARIWQKESGCHVTFSFPWDCAPFWPLKKNADEGGEVGVIARRAPPAGSKRITGRSWDAALVEKELPPRFAVVYQSAWHALSLRRAGLNSPPFEDSGRATPPKTETRPAVQTS